MSEQQKVAFGSLVLGAAFSDADGRLMIKIAADAAVEPVDGSATKPAVSGFAPTRLVTPRVLAPCDSSQEPVIWSNGCNTSVPAALRFLANHDRPSGGESRFNSAHLIQLADEIESMAKRPLYDVPPASVSLGKFLGLVEHCKFSDKRIAELTSQLNAVRLYEQKEVWYWQGDGEDHLGSLVCPVVINAEDLRELLRKAVAAVAKVDSPAMPKTILFGDTECECIDWRELSRRGIVSRINCELLHPLGLAVGWDTENGTSFGAIVAAEGELFNLNADPSASCDGNHSSPRCTDPKCWIDEASPGSQSEEQVLYAIPCRKYSGAAGDVPACRSDCACESSHAAPVAAAWNGEGLPSVGESIEFFTDSGYQWCPGAVLYIGEKVLVCCYEHPKEGRSEACIWHHTPGNETRIRPARTPEQIAAEERIKAAQEWLKGVEREYGVEVADECENILMAAEAKRVAK